MSNGGNFLVVWWLGLWASTARGMGSIPRWGTDSTCHNKEKEMMGQGRAWVELASFCVKRCEGSYISLSWASDRVEMCFSWQGRHGGGSVLRVLWVQISPNIFIIILGGVTIFSERYSSLPIIYLRNLGNSIDTEVCQCNSVLCFQLF